MRTTNTKLCRSGAALALCATLAAGSPAHAQDAGTPPSTSATPPADGAPAPEGGGESCSDAFERTQTEKVAGHYVSASAAALECSQVRCNAAIVRECERLYDQLKEETPTVVFAAHKAEGGELNDVRVELDGKPIAEQLNGRPLAVDPGPHEFAFVHAVRGRMLVSETTRVGERARAIEVTFADPNAKPLSAAPVAPVAPSPPERAARRIPVPSYILGGVGVVALGGFIYFRARAVSDWNDANATCAPECTQERVDDIQSKFTLSYVTLGVSVASFAGAGLVYFLTPRPAAVQASVAPTRGGAMAGLSGRF